MIVGLGKKMKTKTYNWLKIKFLLLNVSLLKEFTGDQLCHNPLNFPNKSKNKRNIKLYYL